jgi:signal transduction histidine kinase
MTAASRPLEVFRMNQVPRNVRPGPAPLRRLLAYVAELEVEVDRLRRHNHALRQEAQVALDRMHQSLGPDAAPDGFRVAAGRLAGALEDLRDSPGYHPAHDQVAAIAVRPLAEQVFRWQLRLLGAEGVGLRLELGSEHVEWFPARLRHILDGLFADAIRFRDPAEAESWVCLALQVSPEGYAFRVSDNGVGLDRDQWGQVFELFQRAAPARAVGTGTGLAVVKLLVEQSGGTLDVEAVAGHGHSFLAVLPRYAVDDYLM